MIGIFEGGVGGGGLGLLGGLVAPVTVPLGAIAGAAAAGAEGATAGAALGFGIVMLVEGPSDLFGQESSSASFGSPSNLPIKDPVWRQRVADILAKIHYGGPFRYKQDGSVFANRQGLLPSQPLGYYREYTVPDPSAPNRGSHRLVVGQGGEIVKGGMIMPGSAK
jgi:ribonuclease T1